MNYKMHIAWFLGTIVLVFGVGGCAAPISANSGSTATQTESTPITTPVFSQQFSGTTALVLSAVSLPKGLYKISVNTDGYFQFFDINNTGSILNLSSGEGVGAETVFSSHGDIYTFRTDNITKPWSIQITNISFSNPSEIGSIALVSSRVQKVLGPFSIGTGNYKFTAKTDGYFQLFPIDAYTGKTGSTIFNLSSGNYGSESIYNSKNKLILFRTDNISALYSLGVTRL